METLKDKREILQEKNTEDCGMSRRRKDSWLRNGYRTLPKKSSAVGYGRMWSGRGFENERRGLERGE